MNIKIYMSKINNDSNPLLSIQIGTTNIEVIVDQLNMHCSFDIEHSANTKLFINRNDPSLYRTGYNYHVNKVSIDRVIIDNFWEVTAAFNTPKSCPDSEYMEHSVKVGGGEWITDAMIYNTALFFNGYLEYDIKYPVRRTFFEDIGC